MNDRSLFWGFIVVLLGLWLLEPTSGFFWFRPWTNTTPPISQDLINENTTLRTQLALLSEIKSFLPTTPKEFAPGFVVSRYPFNFKQEFSISIPEGLKVKDQGLVLYPFSHHTSSDASGDLTGVFLGRVLSVTSDLVTAQTLFDPSFKIGVRIGSSGVETILKGGTQPKLTLIPKEARILPREVVYIAGKEFAYGVPIGTIGSVFLSEDKLFQEATIETGYDLSSIRTVLLEKAR